MSVSFSFSLIKDFINGSASFLYTVIKFSVSLIPFVLSNMSLFAENNDINSSLYLIIVPAFSVCSFKKFENSFLSSETVTFLTKFISESYKEIILLIIFSSCRIV